jgi:hypothetical protein
MTELSASDAVAVVRAARLYQDAVWIAESEPELSWLMLVSALESAAGERRKQKQSPIEHLRAWKPELLDVLEGACSAAAVQTVAEMIHGLTGSTKAFIDFVLEFLPSAPSNRPPEWLQHSWDMSALQATLRKIYGYRSKALHGGTPFPAPMCEPPYLDSETKTRAEKPIGLATSTLGGTWLAIDSPMILNTFEYITRGTLLKWWNSLIPKASTP